PPPLGQNWPHLPPRRRGGAAPGGGPPPAEPPPQAAQVSLLPAQPLQPGPLRLGLLLARAALQDRQRRPGLLELPLAAVQFEPLRRRPPRLPGPPLGPGLAEQRLGHPAPPLRLPQLVPGRHAPRLGGLHPVQAAPGA